MARGEAGRPAVENLRDLGLQLSTDFVQNFGFQNFKRFGLIKDLELVVCCLWGVVGLSVVVGAGLLGKVVRRLGRSVSTWKSELALMVLFERSQGV